MVQGLRARLSSGAAAHESAAGEAQDRAAAEKEGTEWVLRYMRSYFSKAFAPRQERLWGFLWSLRPGVDVPAYILCWPRDTGKSTTMEGAAIALGATGRRRFILYVCETQKQANEHVKTIASMLEGSEFARDYPLVATPELSEHRRIKGYSQQQLRTASGFKVYGIGLDAAVRGVKLDGDRPDAIFLDDIDGRHDSPYITDKKIETLTESILPTGQTGRTFVMFGQNIVNPHSIMARLVGRARGAVAKARFLLRRRVDIEPSVVGLKTIQIPDPDPGAEPGAMIYKVVGGAPTWPAGQGIESIETSINTTSLRSVMREMQHEVLEVDGALWTVDLLDSRRTAETPGLYTLTVMGLDPSGNDGEGDACGIVIESLTADGVIHTRHDATVRGSPAKWGKHAIETAEEWDVDEIAYEANFGGTMIRDVLRSSARELGYATGDPFTLTKVHVKQNKQLRAHPVSVRMENRQNYFVADLPDLEAEMTGWAPGMASPNRLDAKVIASTRLIRELRTRDKKTPGLRTSTRSAL